MQILYGYNSFENSYEVSNYPWGFRYKTKRKYWVETTKHGDRICYSTLNPKTDSWCKVKKSTYSAVIILYLDKNDHVKHFGFMLGWSDAEQIKSFLDKIDYEKLSNEQKMKVCQGKTINHVNSKIEYKIENVTSLSQEEKEAREIKKKETDKKLNNYANHIYGQCLVKNNLIQEVK